MLSVPKKANDAMHLSMLEGAATRTTPHLRTPTDATESLIPFNPLGFDGNIDSQGELILQESFQVWDPKTLIRKGRDRHLFLFEMSLVFSKEVKDSNGRSKYLYKSKLFVRDQTVIFVPCSLITAKKNNTIWAMSSSQQVFHILQTTVLPCVFILF